MTGGASSRLGAPKAELGPGLSGLTAVREDPPGEGPLAAFAAGTAALAAAGHGGVVLALAVDLPFVEPPLLDWLAARPGDATVVPRVDGMPQTLCARYAPTAGDEATRLLADGQRSLRSLLAALEAGSVDAVQYVDEDEWGEIVDARAFVDVDTAADVARAGLDHPR